MVDVAQLYLEVEGTVDLGVREQAAEVGVGLQQVAESG